MQSYSLSYNPDTASTTSTASTKISAPQKFFQSLVGSEIEPETAQYSSDCVDFTNFANVILWKIKFPQHNVAWWRLEHVAVNVYFNNRFAIVTSYQEGWT